MQKTILTVDFLTNTFGYQMKADPRIQKALIARNYDYICGLVNKFNVCGMTVERMESDYITTKERKEWFMKAQAYQLIYDEENGKGSMFRGEDEQYDICRDTIDCLAFIGLINPASPL